MSRGAAVCHFEMPGRRRFCCCRTQQLRHREHLNLPEDRLSGFFIQLRGTGGAQQLSQNAVPAGEFRASMRVGQPAGSHQGS